MAKKHVPTDKLRAWVKKRILLGNPLDQIARGVGVRLDTLKEMYAEELKFADEANANVKGMLYKQAMEGNTAAIIFWCKTKLGMKETERREISGPDQGPIEYVPAPKPSMEEWEDFWLKSKDED